MAKGTCPIIGITLGDAAGIGPELVAKAAARAGAKGMLTKDAIPLIVGDEALLKMGMKIAGVDFKYNCVTGPAEVLTRESLSEGVVHLLDTKSVNVDALKLGEAAGINGKEECERLVDCVNYCKMGLLDGFCFAPLNKSAMKAGGYDHPSEHEFFAELYELKNYYSEMNVLDKLWNIRVTSHIPLKDVPGQITVENILKASMLGYETLMKAGFNPPRLAMAALNPHAGESGTCGTEEITVIAEAIRLLKDRGVTVEGPFAADTLFIRAFRGDFDGVITMYHDQGQIAIKLKGFEHTVTVSCGMPHPITTPAHGTAYDIAGKGTALVSTFEHAYNLCVKMAQDL